MRTLRSLWVRLQTWMGNHEHDGQAGDDEFDRELAAHLEMHTADNIRAGMSPEEARRKATIQLGGIEPARQRYREQRTLPWLENLVQDLKFAVRQLRKNPGFAWTAITLTALGLSASASIFAFVDATLIQPLPYRDPSRLVSVFETANECPQCNLSYPDFLDWKRRATVFQDFELYQERGVRLQGNNGAERAGIARVTSGFLRTLGVTPMLGRDLRPGEDQPGAPKVALLSYGTWQKRFAGALDVVGRTIRLDDDVTLIVGVLPKSFHFSPVEPAEFWIPFQAVNECDLRRSCHSSYGIARLKDGVSVEAARANVISIAKQLEREHPDTNRDQGATLQLLSTYIIGKLGEIILVLFGGAALLLLIAAVNTASLLLVRSEARRREVALRRALGASTPRIAAQFLAEGLILALGGTALGMAATAFGTKLLSSLIPARMMDGLPFLQTLGLTPHVVAFCAAVGLASALLFAVTPSLRLLGAGASSSQDMADGSRGSAGTVWRRVGAQLVVVELAIAAVLLVSAALHGKSLYQLLAVEMGMKPDRVVLLPVALPNARYGTPEKQIAAKQDLMRQIAALPGVASAALTTTLPVGFSGNTTWVQIPGRSAPDEHYDIPQREVSESYFTTLGSRLRRGRFFNERDNATTEWVTVVNDALARQYFPNEDPVGKQLSYLGPNAKRLLIVGVVEDIREGPLDQPVRATLYVPFNQQPDRGLGFIVRTSREENTVLKSLATTIRQYDPEIMLGLGASMKDRIKDTSAAYMHRSVATLAGAFAGVALLLSVIGLYGVVAYSVSRRTRELGVRIALGAARGAVYKLIFREAALLISLGLAAGLTASVGAAVLMRSLLFGVRAWDPGVLATAGAVLGACALAASFVPARRAASVNPVEALRTE